MTRRTVTIFTKPECGLCEEAEEVIESVRAKRPFDLVRRNILESYADYERYKHDIPVILVNGMEVARHHVDVARLESAIKTTFVVMAKVPAPGRVKTRLVPPLTNDEASGLYVNFLMHVVKRLRSRGLVVCYDPPEDEAVIREFVSEDLAPQTTGDLGRRLAAAAEMVRPVIFLGVDSPDVPNAHIDRVAQLVLSHDVVIAPADDGGFWSVAVNERVDAAKLFADIEWSSGREFGQVLERANRLGYNVAVADRWADVDRPADLAALIERLKASDVPEDRELLAKVL